MPARARRLLFRGCEPLEPRQLLTTAPFQSLLTQFGATGDAGCSYQVADWDLDGYEDLFQIAYTGTASGMVEISVTSGFDNSQLFNAATVLPQEVPRADGSTGHWDYRIVNFTPGNFFPDLVAFQDGPTGVPANGMGVWVYVLHGDDGFSTINDGLQNGNDEGGGGGSDKDHHDANIPYQDNHYYDCDLADYNNDGVLDLYAVDVTAQHNSLDNQEFPVYVVSGAADASGNRFGTRLFQTTLGIRSHSTTTYEFHPANIDGIGAPDLVAVSMRVNENLNVHVLSGSSNLQTLTVNVQTSLSLWDVAGSHFQLIDYAPPPYSTEPQPELIAVLPDGGIAPVVNVLSGEFTGLIDGSTVPIPPNSSLGTPLDVAGSLGIATAADGSATMGASVLGDSLSDLTLAQGNLSTASSIQVGTLHINAGFNLKSAGVISARAGGVTVDGGSSTVDFDGMVDGASPVDAVSGIVTGTGTLYSTLTLHQDASFSAEQFFDPLVIGALTLDGNPKLSIAPSLFTTGTFLLIDTSSVNGQFGDAEGNPLPEGAVVAMNSSMGLVGRVSYLGGKVSLVVQSAPQVQLNGSVTYVEDSAAVAIAPTAYVYDFDSSNLNGGSVTVAISSNADVNDRLEIFQQGTGPGQISFSGTNVTYGGSTIGTFTGGTGGAPLVVTFNSDLADSIAAEALVQNIRFRTISHTPSSASRSVQFVVSDGDGNLSDPSKATAFVQVTPVNDPTVVAKNLGATVNEGSTVTITSALLQVTDADNTAAQLKYTFTGSSPGTLKRNGIALVSGDTFTQADIAAGLVIFTHNGSEGGNFTISLAIDDATTHWLNITFQFTVVPINDPPVLGLSGTAFYTENNTPSILAPTAVVTDPDSPDFATGKLTATITAAGTGNDELSIVSHGLVSVSSGTVSYSGTAVGTIAGGSGVNPLVVTFNSAATPAAVQAVTQSLAFRVISDQPATPDRTVSVVVTDGDGGTSPTRTKTVKVIALNDAPVMAASATLSLGSINEDTTNPAGVLVSGFADAITSDPDANPQKGIAVIGLTEKLNGTWQFSLDNGANWTSFGTPAETEARLLVPENRVRFVPNPDYNGTPQFQFRAWDRTNGLVAGNIASTDSQKGGTGAYSAISKSATLTVTPVNDAPMLNTSVDVSLGSIGEDTPAASVSGALVSSLLAGVSDVDAGAVQGIAVISLTEKVHGAWQFSLDNGTNWTSFGTPAETQARVLMPGNRVRFVPNADYNGTPQLQFRAWDRTDAKAAGDVTDTTGHKGGSGAYSTVSKSAAVTVTPVNDKPVILLGGTTLGYTRDAAAITLAPSATMTDIDNANFNGGELRVWIAVGGGSANTLAIGSGFTVDASNNVKSGSTIIGTRSSNGVGTNELKIALNANATVAIVQQLLRSITYRNVGGTAGTRNIGFSISDGSGGLSDEKIKTVNVV